MYDHIFLLSLNININIGIHVTTSCIWTKNVASTRRPWLHSELPLIGHRNPQSLLKNSPISFKTCWTISLRQHARFKRSQVSRDHQTPLQESAHRELCAQFGGLHKQIAQTVRSGGGLIWCSCVWQKSQLHAVGTWDSHSWPTLPPQGFSGLSPDERGPPWACLVLPADSCNTVAATLLSTYRLQRSINSSAQIFAHRELRMRDLLYGFKLSAYTHSGYFFHPRIPHCMPD